MAGLAGSYVNQVLDLNLTSLGSEDFISFTSGGVAIRKTGGGSLLTAERWDWGSDSSFGAGGNTGFGGTGYKVTTTDATASNITNKADCVYTQMDNTQACGWKVTAPAGLGERVIKLYFAHYLPSGQTETLHLTASISGSGAPTPIDVSLSTNNGSDTDLTATITYTAGVAGQTITIGYYPSASATGGYRYMGIRGVWLGPAASSATIVDLAAAAFGFTRQNPQLKATVNAGTRSFAFPAQGIQNRLTIAQAIALLPFSAQGIQTGLINRLTAAVLSFSAQVINAVNTGGAVVIDLALATFAFVTNTAQMKATAGMALASLNATAQAIQLKVTNTLALAQNRLTAQGISAKLALTMAVANTLRFISSAVQNRVTVPLTKATLYFNSLLVEIIADGTDSIVVRFRYSMTRFRQLLRSRKY